MTNAPQPMPKPTPSRSVPMPTPGGGGTQPAAQQPPVPQPPAPQMPQPSQAQPPHPPMPGTPQGGMIPPQPHHPYPPAAQTAPPQHGYPAHQGQAHAHPPHAAPSAPIAPMGYDDPSPSREEGERALPQISIQAFCDRNETAACINEATRDWRMRRTNVKIYMGGLPAAIDFYQKERTPSLVIVESGLRGQELFSQLEQLASVCDEGTKVVIIGATNDIRLYRQLMEKGVSDYIVPPIFPLGLIRSLSELYVDPDAPFTGRAVAFFGAKGGVGSSTMAHNISWVMAERLQQETSLIDLDSSWGTTALDFAYDSASGLEEALAEPDRLDETLLDRIMVRHTKRLSLLPTSSSLNMKPVFDTDAYERIVDGVRSISPMAVLDLPHIWSDWTTNVLTNVDDVVITAIPDLANLRNTKNLIDFLKTQRPNDPDPLLILNQTGRCRSKDEEISVENFAVAVGLEPTLVIGFDPDTFSRALNEGKMLAEMKATDGLIPGFDYLGSRLRAGDFSQSGSMGAPKKRGDAKDGGGKSSLIGGLFKRKSKG